MNANQVIDVMGGRREVMRITGLSKGRISQWITGNHIPGSWLVAFRALKPEAFPHGVAIPVAREDNTQPPVGDSERGE
ncbi:hypothetical protein P3T40_003431 [Paraburkholderia sp. EB58]